MKVGRFKKVIIADDDTVTRKLLASIVSSLGLVPIEATSGRRAWEVYQDNPDTVLVITDMAMPEMDGRALIQAMSDHGNLKQTPVIIVSGMVRLSQIVDLLELGVARFVPKPINSAEFKTYITQLTSADRKAASNEAPAALTH